MNELSPAKTCPSCGTPIPRGAPEGLCPKCLLEEVMATTPPGAETGPRANPPSLELLKNAFPQLEILEFIGQGGMGFVFKARQLKLNRLVALKILPEALARDAAFAERFAREGQVLARLSHPNVVTVHDFGQSGGFFYLLMEYVDGVNLRQAMRASRFTQEQALEIVPSICAALQYAHEEGVLHRDIKPENILLDTKGRVKIADFGIAKLMRESESESEGGREMGRPEEDLTQPGATPGTPKYMAPEQIETPSEVDHRADIYSLGVVFYEMLTGELPSGHFRPPSRKTPLDPRVDAVVARALERQREKRFQSAGEIRTRVEAITGTGAGAGNEPARSIPAAAASNPISLSPPVSTALFLGLIGLIGLMLNQVVSLPRMLLPGIFIIAQRGLIEVTVTVAGIAGISWLGWQVWRRRVWLLAPVRVAAAPGNRMDATWLRLAWMGVLLCLSLQFLWFLLSQVSVLAQAVAASTHRAGFSSLYESFTSGAWTGAGSQLHYVFIHSVLGILLIVFLVRRELRRSDLISPAPPPIWAPRAVLLGVAISLLAALPIHAGVASTVHIGYGSFIAVAAFALFTFSRIWRGIAMGFLSHILIISVMGLLNFVRAAAGGYLPGEWSKVGGHDPVTWGIIVQLANLVCLSAALAVLVLPRARAAFGLRPNGSRISPAPSLRTSDAATASHE
jgi:tRNA A-37 threonylcarbamoyl transferase component Bud32